MIAMMVLSDILAVSLQFNERVQKTNFSVLSRLRDDIQKKTNYFKWALPVKLSPPPPHLNGQGGPFSGRQKRHFSAYYRIKLKSILIIKMIISVMKIVTFLPNDDDG